MNSADIAAKYQKTYFMPPEVTYDWVKKDSITKPPIWCSVDFRRQPGIDRSHEPGG